MSQELKPNTIIENLKPPKGAASLRPAPEKLFDGNPIKLDVLRQLEGQSILSVTQLTREQVIEICKLAAVLESIEIAPYHPLDGKLIITAFFEASTRTRTSFESAVLRLDGKIISIPEAGVTGIAKGESLSDIGEMFNAYGDVVIMRHKMTESVDEIRRRLRIPLINAGNGTGEHPTQALADWYALLKWRPEFARPECVDDKKLNFGILGTPGSMRTVKSFLLLSLLFREHIKQVAVISEMSDPFGADLVSAVEKAGIEYSITHKMKNMLWLLDVIYMNSITMIGDSYRSLGEEYKLTSGSDLRDDAVILHPLARLDELDTSLDDTEHNLYFSQAHGAVFIRQALLMTVLGRLDRLPDEIPTA